MRGRGRAKAAAILANADVVSDGPAAGVPFVVVEDPSLAFGYVAATYGHPSFSLEIVGVTGTERKDDGGHLILRARRHRRRPWSPELRRPRNDRHLFGPWHAEA